MYADSQFSQSFAIFKKLRSLDQQFFLLAYHFKDKIQHAYIYNDKFCHFT